MPKSEFISHFLRVVRVFCVRIGCLHLEGMSRGPQTDDRSTSLKVSIEVLHLTDREILKAQEDNRQIGLVQRLHAWHVRVAGDDLSGLLVDVEQDRAAKTVVLREDARQFRQRLSERYS